MKETIVNAAIRLERNKGVFVARTHAKIIEDYGRIYKRVLTSEPYREGFVTNEDRFVSREEAGKIAWEAGQIDQPVERLQSHHLGW